MFRTQEAKMMSNATEQHIKTAAELVAKARSAHDFIKKSTGVYSFDFMLILEASWPYCFP